MEINTDVIYTSNYEIIIPLFIDDEIILVYQITLEEIQERTNFNIEQEIEKLVKSKNVSDANFKSYFYESLIDKIDGYLGKMEKNLVDYLYKELYFSTTFEQYRSF